VKKGIQKPQNIKERYSLNSIGSIDIIITMTNTKGWHILITNYVPIRGRMFLD